MSKRGEEARPSGSEPIQKKRRRRRMIEGEVLEDGLFECGGIPFSLKGLKSALCGIQCFLCCDYDGSDVNRIECGSGKCPCWYVCSTCARHEEFKKLCPICGVYATVHMDPTATMLMKESLVKCPKHPECEAIGLWRDIQQHMETECDYNLEICNKNGCGMRYKVKERAQHGPNCQSVMCRFTLEYNGKELACGWTGNQRDLMLHGCAFNDHSFKKLVKTYNYFTDLICNKDTLIEKLEGKIQRAENSGWEDLETSSDEEGERKEEDDPNPRIDRTRFCVMTAGS